MNKKVVDLNCVDLGERLPELKKTPTRIQLFRYSAITWNSHKIHFDKTYAIEEGYPDILVQSHLHGAFLTQMCTDWMGEKGMLKSFSISVKNYAIPGDTLICSGVVTEKRIENGKGLIYIDLLEKNQNETICATGKASIQYSIQ